MDIHYLQYVLMIAAKGSINKAAAELDIPQPYLTGILKSLEQELGILLFYRTNQGVVSTEQGNEFLAIARNMVDEYRQMSLLSEQDTQCRFALSAGYYSFVSNTFVKLCSEYQSVSRLQLSLSNLTSMGVLQSVYDHTSDLGIIISPHENLLIPQKAKRMHLHLQRITGLQYYIILRREHPLLKEEHFSAQKLLHYPFVDYNENLLLRSDRTIDDIGIINPDKLILVDETDTRYNIICTSDAFSLGCYPHPVICSRYCLSCIPLPDLCFDMYAISKQPQIGQVGKRYLELLNEEIAGGAQKTDVMPFSVVFTEKPEP